MDNRKTCWVITGPTASGKTGLSIKLAKEFNCEIISMDSMQIYKKMDIGTAKPDEKQRDGIVHHMLDIVEPSEGFTVTQYSKMAQRIAEEIFSRGKQVLFVGGTGFYLRALRQPMAMGVVPGNQNIRDRLQAQAAMEGGRERLHQYLEQIDPVTANRLHVNDVRRVVRAIEVYEITGRPFSNQPQTAVESAFRYRVVSLEPDRAILYERINERVDRMIQQGLVDEIKGLLELGVPPTAQAMKAIGYKELLAWMRGETTWEKAVSDLKQATRHYAKRQLTWMRREEDVTRIDSYSSQAYDQIKFALTGDIVND